MVVSGGGGVVVILVITEKCHGMVRIVYGYNGPKVMLMKIFPNTMLIVTNMQQMSILISSPLMMLMDNS